MTNSSKSRDDFHKRIKALRAQFEIAAQAFEQNETAESLQTCAQLFEKADTLLNEVAADYRNALSAKLPDAEPEKKFISEASFSDGKPDTDRMLAMLTKLDRTLAFTEREIRHNYPSPWRGWASLSKYRRKIIPMGAGLIALIAAALIWNAHYLKGKGLMGTYYDDADLQSPFKERLDHTIDFNWDADSPLPRWRKDDFSIRWTGYLNIKNDGVYEFFTHSDDGVRLRIDKKPVIENWTVHRIAIDRGAMTLTAGPHEIELEYFEKKKRAVIQLYWKPEGQSRPEIIPASVLTPSAPSAD